MWTLLLAAGCLAPYYSDYARVAELPRADAVLSDVSADGTRMLVIESPAQRAVLIDAAGERPLPWRNALLGRLGPGAAYVAHVGWFDRPSGGFMGLQPRCAEAVESWTLPVWRADGRAWFRRTESGVVLEGPHGCERFPGKTGAAFAGATPILTDGVTVWIGGVPRWQGPKVRLMTAAGTAWLTAGRGFAEVTPAGIEWRERDIGLADVREMAHRICLVDPDGGCLLRLANPPPWASKCWRPGDARAREYPEGAIPIDVDLVVVDGVLRDATTGTERRLPAQFPVDQTTRPLPDGSLRTFDERGYWQLDPSGAVRTYRWGGPDPSLHDSLGPPSWRDAQTLR